MKFAYYINDNMARKFKWAIQLGHHAFFESLKKYVEFRSFAVLKESREIYLEDRINQDVLNWNLFRISTDSESYFCSSVDCLIIPVCLHYSDDLLLELKKLIKDNPHCYYVFLWFDCYRPLEEAFEPILEMVPGGRYWNLTHWSKNTLPHQVCIDYCYSPRLELPLTLESVEAQTWDFGYNGYFCLKKSEKFLAECLEASPKNVSIIGSNPSQSERLETSYGHRLDFHGMIESWEKVYPLMSRAYIHPNAQRPRHHDHGSLVKRPTMCAEAGSLCLLDPLDDTTQEIFPYAYRNLGLDTFKTYVSLEPKDRFEVLSEYRNWIKQKFNSDERVSKFLELFCEGTDSAPDFISLR